uniref:Uncharacterized protein n=1 Tax=Bos indicus x Bos taurus TaxID=30522 RepID=A0A4W2FTZ3_BOBOX
MKLLPSVVLKLFLAAVLSALVTGQSLERLWRVLAAGASNLDSPTQSTDQTPILSISPSCFTQTSQ